MHDSFKRNAVGLLACAGALILTGCGGGSSTPAVSGGGAPSSYSIGGTVSGLSSGQTVTLADNGGDALTVSADGGFTFSSALSSGASYAVTVQSSPSGDTCAVSNGSGTVSAGNVTGVAVSCTAATSQTHTIGGTVSGLSTGQSVTLRDNGSDTVVVSSNGGFTFPTALASGSAYSVSVGVQPTAETCSISNAAGTVGSTNVSNVAVACAASTEGVVYSFGAAGSTDAAHPSAGALIMDQTGNLYGTTNAGGTDGFGTVYELSAATGQETVLYSFGTNGGSDGTNPTAGLLMDGAGDLYGTTENGGTNNDGSVFKLTPIAGGGYTESVVYSFSASGGSDGVNPSSGSLIMDSSGDLYGTTYAGGANGDGTVFKVNPATGAETPLYSFGASASDGQHPYAGVIMDSTGHLYGTTSLGGANGFGTVFELSPSGAGAFTETVLYAFGASATDGQVPYGGLIRDSAGNLYGTTYQGGAHGDGTVFELASGTSAETILHSFGSSATDGINPEASLIRDSAGNLYGTTQHGGGGYGTVFEISGGAESVLYAFLSNGTSDGSLPTAGLLRTSAGVLYGTTYLGGAHNEGTVFRVE